MKELTKVQIETRQFPSENKNKVEDLDLGISQFYLCPDKAEMSSDGIGGAIITWDDDRNADCDIYAQRVNSMGNTLWSTNGKAICTANKGQHQPEICSDGVGGAIIIWLDSRAGLNSYDWEIYAQRVNSSGDIQWINNGIPICTVSGSKTSLRIFSDGTGGAIIVWVDARSTNSGIYAQRVNSLGEIQWMMNGVPICTAPEYKGTIQICSDGIDGAIITWQDEWSGNRDIYAQRINSSGDVLWNINGVAVCVENDYQGFPEICDDGSNGAIITWRDQRSGPSHIYAQRVNSSGKTQWTDNGVVISIASDIQTDQQICSDGFNGAFITWHTWVIDASEESNVYAQRINASGKVQWIANGVPICTAIEGQVEPQIIGDGAGSSIITWLDRRDGSAYYDLDIYAQRVDYNGVIQWVTDGELICTAKSSKVRIIRDVSEGAIILWQDERYEKPSIYAQRINSNGDVQWSANGVAIRTYGRNIFNLIPGFNLFFQFSIFSIVIIIIIKKIEKSSRYKL
ncbi:MAG: hypothetical protein ACFFCI_04415 [Promethearchaeota archaeon]